MRYKYVMLGTSANCEWCDELHGGVWCPMYEQVRRNMVLKTTIMYNMPSGNDVLVYAVADEVDAMALTGLEMTFFTLDGEPIEMAYSREVFEDVEDAVHQVIFEDQEGARSEEGAKALSGEGDEAGVGASGGEPGEGGTAGG